MRRSARAGVGHVLVPSELQQRLQAQGRGATPRWRRRSSLSLPESSTTASLYAPSASSSRPARIASLPRSRAASALRAASCAPPAPCSRCSRMRRRARWQGVSQLHQPALLLGLRLEGADFADAAPRVERRGASRGEGDEASEVFLHVRAARLVVRSAWRTMHDAKWHSSLVSRPSFPCYLHLGLSPSQRRRRACEWRGARGGPIGRSRTRARARRAGGYILLSTRRESATLKR